MNVPLERWIWHPITLMEHPRELLPLGDCEVQIWRVFVEQQPFDLQTLHAILSLDEQERAAGFVFERDRDRYIIARGVLRVLLSHYLGIAPDRLSFCYGSYGKPELSPTQSKQTVRFNVSHSRGVILYAVTRDRHVGIDVEYIRRDFPCEEIAQKFFAPEEHAILHQIPIAMRYPVFFSCWTRKEAYIKAMGKGLSLPLHQFTVSMLPGEPARLLSTQWARQEAHRWLLQELIPASDYVGALAVEGQDCRAKLLEISVDNSGKI